MLGCELTDADEWTMSLLTNDAVLGLTKHSHGAHQILRTGDLIVWQSEGEQGGQYVAMFNIVGWPDDFSVSFSKLGLEGTYEVTDLWSGEKEGTQDQALTADIPAHGVKLVRLDRVE